MTRVLGGIRVLDFSRYAAGPYCSMILADMGAEVIKIEKPGGEEDRRLGPFAPNGESMPYGMILTRNKKGVTLSLKSHQGEEILKELVKCSDVVLHNFTLGSEEANILKYESLKEINPVIILVCITGFGTSGPYASQPCFDSIAQALAGGMSYTGFPDSPPTRDAVAHVDFGTGTYAALGTMLALYHRQRTGQGQMVDVALMDTAVSFVASLGPAAEWKVLGGVRPQIGNHSFYNFSDAFPAKDGWVMISVIGNPLWRRFLACIGREDIIQDPKFKDDLARFENRRELGPIVSQWVGERTVEEVVKLLQGARVPCGKVNNIAEMAAHPQVEAREMLVDMEYPEVGQVPLSGVVIKLSQTPGQIERPAPKVGEHNSEVYQDLLGIKAEELSQLKAEGII